MKKFFKRAGISAITIVLLLLFLVASFLIRGGAFRSVVAVSPGACEIVEIGSGSAEDIQIDRVNQIALMSVLDRRGIVVGRQVKGTVLALPLNSIGSKPEIALANQPDDFRPHGLSLFTDENGTQTLLVINHSTTLGERIELFEKKIGQTLFEHRETISSPLLVEPNDIVAISARRFYIANDSGASNGLERAAEMLLAIGLSPIIYFDGVEFSVPADDLRSSGGINVNKEKTEIYVGETSGKAIRIYGLNPDGTLAALKNTISLQSGVDNIDVDVDGNLWIANHTNTLALVKHFGDATSPAPTQIQRIRLSSDEAPQIDTIYEQNGDVFSAGSVGTLFNNQLLIGSITEPNVLRCYIND
jgi:arylesterase / paraoxonase